MNLFKKKSPIDEMSDASLVVASLGGDRDAFGNIVGRYQSLLCSVAYSSLGNLSESEDVAQEAFVEAWKKLESLREPEKLKSWLTGILRFKISHYLRKKSRQPVSRADEINESMVLASEDESTEETTMREEEQALLWQALEKVPETYREPLVLYYREHRSIEHVAYELDLTESTVRQRLSRGRKILQEKMMSFVEGALAKSKPGGVFTMGVLAAITTIAPQAKAATLGVTAVKVGSWLKWASVVAFLATISGVISTFFGMMAAFDQSRTKRERRAVVKTVSLFFGFAIVYIVGVFILRKFAMEFNGDIAVYAITSQVLLLGFLTSYAVLTVRMLKGLRSMRAQERIDHPEFFQAEIDQVGSKKREYKSKFTLLGFPLFHFRLGMPEEGDKPVVGWIAGGDRAYGLLFAWGGFAVAPVSVGIVSVGLISVGAIGLGLIGTGTVGIGIIAFGAAAIGYKAYASLSALGWDGAFSNGFSIANEGAIGPVALAEQVNNEAAAQIVNLAMVDQSYLWVLGAITILVIIPAAWYAKKVRQRMG